MRAVSFLLLLCAAPLVASAQSTTADLKGIVFDSTRAVVPQAELTIVNEATGIARVMHSNAQGEYAFPRLAPGVYRLTVVLQGFETAVRSGIELRIGQVGVMDIVLTVGNTETSVVVSGAALQVDTQGSSLSGVMDRRAIRELPLNGRDFAQLALLQVGVAPSRRTSDSGGPGTKLVINGAKPSQVSFLLDGSDINDANNNTPGSAAGVLLGVDTLEEFRVLTNNYNAAYGRSGGGVVSAVTRSGINQFHGSAFEFHRNSALDAKNFFDAKDAPIPEFRRNQFGAVVDGPIVRNRTFFLASYEGLRQRLGVTTRTVVPDASARAGLFPGQAPIAVHPAIPPYLALVPLPNERNFGDGTGEYVAASTQVTDEDFFTGRVDHRASDRLSFFGRFTQDDTEIAVPDGIGLVQAETTSRNQYFTSEATYILNERMLNSFRFSVNRSRSANGNSYLREVNPALSFFPGRPLGQISVTGFLSIGPSRFGPSYSDMTLFQFSDDLSFTRGRHSVRIGGDHRFYRLATSRPQSPYGFYQFNGLTNFLRNIPASVELTLPDSELDRNWRQSMTVAYVQDDIRLTPQLTLNLGVRYERVSVPEEANGLSSNFRNPLTDAAPTVGPIYSNPSNRNFAPRVGVAWDPFGDGKTGVRAGFGVFFDPLWTDFYANPGNRLEPFYVLGSVRNPTFPDAGQVVGSPLFVLGRQDVLVSDPENPYFRQFNASLQRELWRSGVVTVSYSGSRGRHLVRFVDGNQAIPQILPDGRKFFPADSAPRNPNLTGVRYKVTDGESSYNALQTSFTQRATHGFQLQLNYVYSKSVDDGSVTVTQGGDNDLPQDPDDRLAERGLSNYDMRHYFVAHWIWDVPALPGPAVLGRGWQLNAVTTLASGNPFSVVVGFDRANARFQAGTSPQRPDLVPGASDNPILGGPDRYFDPAAFALPEAGFYGNLGRNTLIGPGLATTDLSLNKRFDVGSDAKVQLRVEIFNVFNRPNFALPSQRTVLTGTGPVGSAGRITSTTTSARQIQLGLKIAF